MGRGSSEQPLFLKEGYRPALMIGSSSIGLLAPLSPGRSACAPSTPSLPPSSISRPGLLHLVENFHSLTTVACAPAWPSLIHLPGSLRSTGMTPLLHYYEASDSCPAHSTRTGLPASRHPDFPPFRLQPPHASRDGFLMLPLSLTGVSVPSQEPPFGLRHSRAGSPTSCGRIEFVILPTGGSPPVASHPASWRRSYFWIQTGEHLSEEDFHLSIWVRSQAHERPLCERPMTQASHPPEEPLIERPLQQTGHILGWRSEGVP